MKKFEIRAIRCNKCKDIIYSRLKHDMRYCSCKECFIDGGSSIIGYEEEYKCIRVGGDYTVTTVVLGYFEDVKEVQKALFLDWQNKTNNYGRVLNCV